MADSSASTTSSGCRIEPDKDGIHSCQEHSSDEWRVVRALGAETGCDRYVIRANASVARDPDANPRTVRRLAGSEHPGVRTIVAQRHDLPLDVAEDLAADPEQRVRRSLAHNPDAPEQLLRELAGSDSATERWWVAENPSLPQDVLRLLAYDPSEAVRYRAGLPSTVHQS